MSFIPFSSKIKMPVGRGGYAAKHIYNIASELTKLGTYAYIYADKSIDGHIATLRRDGNADQLRQYILDKFKFEYIRGAHDAARKLYNGDDNNNGHTSTAGSEDKVSSTQSNSRQITDNGKMKMDIKSRAVEARAVESKADKTWVDNVLSDMRKESELAELEDLSDERILAELKDNEDKTNKIEAKAETLANYVTQVEFAKYRADNGQRVTSVERDIKSTQEIMAKTNNAVILDMLSVQKRLETVEKYKAQVIEIKRADHIATIGLGVQHKHFRDLLTMCQARVHIWCYGPAGTGKSTAAEACAKAMGLKFYTDNKLEAKHEVSGYNNAGGHYMSTQFRKAFETGGVYCGDEIDGSLPSATLAFNTALANGWYSFPDSPDKVIRQHPDFIFIGAANTAGHGGHMEYVSRLKQDAAFMNRFVGLDWPLDEILEDSITANKSWLAYVRATRANLAKNSIKGHMITPRASIFGTKVLRCGLSVDKTIEGTVAFGLSPTQWKQIAPGGENWRNNSLYTAIKAQ